MKRNLPTRRDFLKCLATTPLVGSATVLQPGTAVSASPSPLGTTRYLDQPLEYWLSSLVAAEDESEAAWEVTDAVSCFGEDAVRPLWDAIHRVPEAKQQRLLDALSLTGRAAIPSLLRLLKHHSADLRAAACQATHMAMYYDWHLSKQVSQAFAQLLGSVGQGSLAEIETAFRFADEAMQDANANRLVGVDSLVALIHRVEDRDPAVRVAAIRALGDVDWAETHRASVIIAAIHALTDACEEVRVPAAWTLRDLDYGQRLGDLSRTQVTRLKTALNDPCPEVRRLIGEIFASATQLAPSYEPVWQRYPDSDDAVPDERSTARSSCSECSEEEVVEAVTAAIQERRCPLIPPVPTLLANIAHPRAKVRAAVAAALGKTASPTDTVLQSLYVLLGDSDMAVRCAAAEALGECHSNRLDVGWRLWHAMQDRCARVAEAAELSLKRFLVEKSAERHV